MTIPVSNRQILVVEDEFAIADDLVRAFRSDGLLPLRPVADVGSAMTALDACRVDFAVVDINLDGAISFEFAGVLRRRGIPFLFLTGYESTIVPPEFHDVTILQKPYDSARVVACVRQQEGMSPPAG